MESWRNNRNVDAINVKFEAEFNDVIPPSQILVLPPFNPLSSNPNIDHSFKSRLFRRALFFLLILRMGDTVLSLPFT